MYTTRYSIVKVEVLVVVIGQQKLNILALIETYTASMRKDYLHAANVC